MTRPIIAVLVVVALALAGVAPAAASHGTGTECSFQVTATDASGTEVTVDQAPSSVVVLQPSAAQTMWEIGAQDKVVGMPKNPFTSYLNGTEGKTDVVGEQSTVLQSRVVDLDPDLVLAPNITNADTVRSLRDAGLTVYFFEDAKSLEDVYQKTLLTGHLVGACEGADSRTDAMRSEAEEVRNAVAGEERPKVLYALGGGYTAGEGTFVHELITAAGGENIAATAGISSYKPISNEVVVQQNPDWIVIPEGRQLPAGEAVNSTTAIQEGQVLRVNPNYLNQAGPLNTIPLQRMAEAFHPDAFAADATPTATATGSSSTGDTATATDAGGAGETVTPTDDSATETPGANGPGFTAVVALVAALVVAVLARRE
ncbi:MULTISPECIES: PGF-CTERM-anchored ABC transporter substrate-binding protein [Salinibaculum]|uniref:PGF-CTERM-anchored ABC transporter substrate-binding protein n=1 Tax=Salinibaculum TaxID=2732368 RepID=UPI0030CAD3C8